MKQKLLILLSMAASLSLTKAQELQTVEKVDFPRYAGTWYEIARLPNSFEKGLECVTATYTLKSNGKIQVLNRGYSVKKDKYQTARGTAHVPDPAFPGRLKVTFFWPFYGNYYITELDEKYQYALVGDPSRKYLWVLSRTKELDENTYSRLINVARDRGFAVEEMLRIRQDCP